jgi:hypothetical protein
MKYLWLILFCLATCKCTKPEPKPERLRPNQRLYTFWEYEIANLISRIHWEGDTLWMFHADTLVGKRSCTRREGEVILDVLSGH